MSEKVRMRHKYTLRERFKQFFTGSRRLDCILDNHSESIQYAGLTQNTGRIIVLDLLNSQNKENPTAAFYIRE